MTQHGKTEVGAGAHIGWRPLLLRRLGSLSPLSENASARLGELTYAERTLAPESEIVDEAGTMAVVASGWAYRYRVLTDGRRVVFDISLPGDLIDLAPPAPECGVVIAASDRLRLVLIRQQQIRRLSESSPEIGKAIAMNAQANTLRLMAHVMRLSRLTAYERLSHFLLEMNDRLDVVGLAPDQCFHMPLNQSVLSDALGITRFHVSRIVKRLRADGWIEMDYPTVRLHNPAGLAELCEYEAWHPGAQGD